MDIFISQLLQVAQIFCLLLIYWSLPKETKKRKYRHTDKYLTRKYLTKFPFNK